MQEIFSCESRTYLFPLRSSAYCRGIAKYHTSLLKVPMLTQTQNYDPFNYEYRVYGRLKDGGREDLAFKAYDYVLLTPE